jgi:hypothetical protein
MTLMLEFQRTDMIQKQLVQRLMWQEKMETIEIAIEMVMGVA